MLIRSVAPATSFNNTVNKIYYDTDTLSNKINLYSIIDKSQAVCGIEIIFGGGKIDEDSNGASHFSTSLIKSGSKGLDANQINNFFELRGAFVQVQSGLDYNTISLYCLTNKLKDTLPFFLNIFTNPTFPQGKLDKLKIKKIQELEINEQKSSFWASKLLKESLFGNHPYGQSANKNDIKLISRTELRNHWKNKSMNNIQFITAAGNFDKSILTTYIESMLPVINSAKNTLRKSIKSNSNNISKTIEKSSQSSLKIGFQTINLNHPNYSALSLGNTLLAGYFGSRLMQSIREDKGLTYGINSSIQHLNEASFVQISADLKAGAGKEVIKLINIELDRIISSTIPSEELNKVKNYLIGEYKSSCESVFDKISRVKFLKSKNLTDSYFNTHYKNILSLKSLDIQKTLESLYSTNTFTIVLVE